MNLFDDSDLRRIQQLAGMSTTADIGPIAPELGVEIPAEPELTTDYEPDLSTGLGGEPFAAGRSAIHGLLDQVHAMVGDVPVSEFKEVISRLRQIAQEAEDYRHALIVESAGDTASWKQKAETRLKAVYGIDFEDAGLDDDDLVRYTDQEPAEWVDWYGRKYDLDPISEDKLEPKERKTLSNYLQEMNNDEMSIGNNRAEAVKNIQQRMNGSLADANTAFNNMQRKGIVKNKNGKMSMAAMGDDEFNNSLNEDEDGIPAAPTGFDVDQSIKYIEHFVKTAPDNAAALAALAEFAASLDDGSDVDDAKAKIETVYEAIFDIEDGLDEDTIDDIKTSLSWICDAFDISLLDEAADGIASTIEKNVGNTVYRVSLVAKGIEVTAETETEAKSYAKEDAAEFATSWVYEDSTVTKGDEFDAGVENVGDKGVTWVDFDLQSHNGDTYVFDATIQIPVEAESEEEAVEVARAIIAKG